MQGLVSHIILTGDIIDIMPDPSLALNRFCSLSSLWPASSPLREILLFNYYPCPLQGCVGVNKNMLTMSLSFASCLSSLFLCLFPSLVCHQSFLGGAITTSQYTHRKGKGSQKIKHTQQLILIPTGGLTRQTRLSWKQS